MMFPMAGGAFQIMSLGSHRQTESSPLNGSLLRQLLWSFGRQQFRGQRVGHLGDRSWNRFFVAFQTEFGLCRADGSRELGDLTPFPQLAVALRMTRCTALSTIFAMNNLRMTLG